jgi:signal transduction histidine kinase
MAQVSIERPLFLLALLGTLAAQEALGGAASVRFLGQNTTPTAAAGVITTEANPAVIAFSIAPGTPRCRHRLEGLQPKWQQRPAEMNLKFGFFDSQGDQIKLVQFPAIGESPSWQGTAAGSPLVTRRESILIPPGTASLSVHVSSSGPPAAVGIYAVSGIGITRSSPAPGTSGGMMLDSQIPDLRDGPWRKSGTHPTMASLVQRKDGPGETTLFVIEDDDPAAHADWATGNLPLTAAQPGESVEVEWQEAYSIALGGAFDVLYDRVPAGDYRFVMEELDLAGRPTGVRQEMALKVPEPYWRTVWFWAGVASLAGGAAFLLGRRLIRNKLARNLRQAQLIADERLRIARDLHDDLGTRLSHISLLGAHSAGALPEGEGRQALTQITDMSAELIRALSETVWMLNSNHDDLESLVSFICRVTGDLCRLSEIRCRIDAMSVDEALPVSHELRHNFSLSVKETVNNALKHSGATEIGLRIWREGLLLKVTISDNGAGFDPQLNKCGTGLQSLAQRMTSIQGSHHIQSLPQGGTSVTMAAPIH